MKSLSVRSRQTHRRRGSRRRGGPHRRRAVRRRAEGPDDKVQLVRVSAPSQQERSRVNALGLDTTEHGDSHGVDVVLHSGADAQKLRAAGFTWRVEDPDLAATMRKAQAADRAYAASVAESPLPSGRTSYRTLADVNAELDALAAQYPSLVRPLTLANPSVLGRPIRGIEITTNAANIRDGKPVFLMMGAHHAREWPSVEHSMEFAYDLLENQATDARAKRIVEGARTIIVPVVNVDGFAISRSAAPHRRLQHLRLRDEAEELHHLGLHAGGVHRRRL